MTKYYSESTCGFYDTSINSDIPTDAISISDDEYSSIMSGLCSGKVISVSSGALSLVDKTYTDDELANAARIKRDSFLMETDYYLMPDYPISAADLTLVKTYRQSLRDLTAQSGFPKTISWPKLALTNATA